MLRHITHSLIALALAASLVTTSVEQAQARHGRGIFTGIAIGLIALAIINASRHHHRHNHHYRQSSRYRDGQECEWRGRTCFDNSYGDHVCKGGEYVCRP